MIKYKFSKKNELSFPAKLIFIVRKQDYLLFLRALAISMAVTLAFSF